MHACSCANAAQCSHSHTVSHANWLTTPTSSHVQPLQDRSFRCRHYTCFWYVALCYRNESKYPGALQFHTFTTTADQLYFLQTQIASFVIDQVLPFDFLNTLKDCRFPSHFHEVLKRFPCHYHTVLELLCSTKRFPCHSNVLIVNKGVPSYFRPYT